MTRLWRGMAGIVLVLAALCASQAQANGIFPAIDLGPAGSVIDPFTPIPLLPIDLPNGGGAHFVFHNNGVHMGHIELTQPTSMYLAVDPNTATDRFGLPVFFYLTDMNHVQLPGTEGVVELGVFDPSLPPGLDNPFFLTPIVATGPIDPAYLENGRYFHDIHFGFEFPVLPNQQFWMFFDQPVITDTWVPEPSSFAALASLSALGLCIGGRRRKRAA